MSGDQVGDRRPTVRIMPADPAVGRAAVERTMLQILAERHPGMAWEIVPPAPVAPRRAA